MKNISCIIRKNTPELRSKLEQSGYTRRFSWNIDTDNVIQTLAPYSDEYITFPDSDYERLTELYPDNIACGTNEELFLAIAALTDDNDKDQYFVTEVRLGSINHPESLIPKGSLIKCLVDKWDIPKNKFDSRGIPSHKATVEDLINDFKNI